MYSIILNESKQLTQIYTTPVNQLFMMEQLYNGFVYYKHKSLIDELESCGLLWCFYQLFGLSYWRHPFTAEHPLVS